jgi:hypothetical protein
MKESRGRHWWGAREFGPGTSYRFNIGPTLVWFERSLNSVLITRETLPGSRDQDYPPPSVDSVLNSVPLLERKHVERFAFGEAQPSLSLSPALADRPVITSPLKPLYILPHTKVTIFASSPLWLKAQLGTHSVLDFPVDRPQDTWFGPTSLRGEFCYATKAFCRLRLEEVQTPLHRVVTAITVNNQSDSPIHVKRMKLPAPNLGVYAQADRRLWTEDVTFNCTNEDEGFASLDVAHKSPKYASAPVRVSQPREALTDNVVTRAFSSIFPWSSL